jgi:hypothetical protein
MAKREPTPAPPQCPLCTTPRRCGSPYWRSVRGPLCKGRPAGPDRCDCLNWCGDDPWLEDYRAQPCVKFFARNPNCKPQPIFLAVYCTTDLIVGPFSPLPWEYQ